MLKWCRNITYTQCSLLHCQSCNSRQISEGLCFCIGQQFNEGGLWRPTDKHDIFDL